MFYLRTTALAAAILILCGSVITLTPQTRVKRFRVEIHNDSSLIINSVYMSRTADEDWGDDRLGAGVLPPDHYLPIEEIIPGKYDFLFIDEHERKCTSVYQIFRDGRIDIDDKWLNTHCKRG